MSGEDLLHKVARGLAAAAGVALVCTMLVAVVNVIGRPVGYPVKGAFEWIGFLTSLVVGLGLADCSLEGRHIAVTFLVDRLPRRAQALIDLVNSILATLFLALSCRELVKYGTEMAVSGQVAFTTMVPYYPFVYLIALGFLLFCFICAVRALRLGREVVRR